MLKTLAFVCQKSARALVHPENFEAIDKTSTTTAQNLKKKKKIKIKRHRMGSK